MSAVTTTAAPKSSVTIFAELFPLDEAALPPLYAYRLILGGTSNLATIGGKLSYRLRRELGGHWTWTSNRIISDLEITPAKIEQVLTDLWREQPNIFKQLRQVKLDSEWQLPTQALADFVARGWLAELEPHIRQLLAKDSLPLGKARLERVYDLRGWVVGGQPAISVSISSRLIYNQDLNQFVKANSFSAITEATNNLTQELEQLWVADKTSTMKGQIIGVAGKLAGQRERLLAITSREEMQEIIEKAADDEWVVEVQAGRTTYDYVASALRIILRSEDYTRFGVDSSRVLQAMRLSPAKRSSLIKEIADLLKRQTFNSNRVEGGLKTEDENMPKIQLVKNAFTSHNQPQLFNTATNNSMVFEPLLRFGRDQVCAFDEKTLLNNLREFGLYRRADAFMGSSANQALRIALVSATDAPRVTTFCDQLRRELLKLNFKVEFLPAVPLAKVARVNIENALNKVSTLEPHIVLGFFPDSYRDERDIWGEETIDEGEEDNDAAYQHFKSLTVGKGLPSQVIYAATLTKPFALNNIVLGILGKTGNVPFVLAEPLPYADLVVGIDIARKRKERLAGSMNATAIARIYFGNGDFLRYSIHDAPLEGETIPTNVLQSLFPIKEFSGKRVVIHRDGYFRGDEKQALKAWGQQIGAEFLLVEIIKSGSPRLYASGPSLKSSNESNEIQQPPKGSALLLSENEALLVSSLPPFANATPQPLHLRTEAPFTVEQAIHSVLSLTMLHYGSVRAPRLPVTIHYSDKIAYLALRGIKPKNLDGNIPYWL